jgi:hypothetical protein
MKIGCEDARWMELAQDRVHCASFDDGGAEPSGSATIVFVRSWLASSCDEDFVLYSTMSQSVCNISH